MTDICCVCRHTIYMVPEGSGPVVCVHHEPKWILKYLDQGQELGEWGQNKVAWAKDVLAGKIKLGEWIYREDGYYKE